MKKRLAIATVILAILGLAACSTVSLNQQKAALWILKVYNAEYDAYLVEAAKSDLSSEKRIILRKKKALLTEADPLIDVYVAYVETGQMPINQSIGAVEDRLIDIINKLVED